jgi:hypothetical protein
MAFRVLSVIIIAFSTLFFPIWISILLCLAAMVYFNFFAEAVALFLLSDLLFGVREARLDNAIFISFCVSAIVLIGIEIIKKKSILS